MKSRTLAVQAEQEGKETVYVVAYATENYLLARLRPWPLDTPLEPGAIEAAIFDQGQLCTLVERETLRLCVCESWAPGGRPRIVVTPGDLDRDPTGTLARVGAQSNLPVDTVIQALGLALVLTAQAWPETGPVLRARGLHIPESIPHFDLLSGEN